jgi:hypothetical protein
MSPNDQQDSSSSITKSITSLSLLMKIIIIVLLFGAIVIIGLTGYYVGATKISDTISPTPPMVNLQVTLQPRPKKYLPNKRGFAHW